ncbi:MAG: rRNA maturation RNase YbeY [Turicibacter sp.]|nr:rRNA maturation RNase YbeY [Turicibacter sp.]
MIYKANVPTSCDEIIDILVARFLELMPVPKDIEISLSFVSEEEIQELNRQYRNIDEPTDVLSFPFLDSCEICTKNAPISLGDIVISTKAAREQAELYGHSFEREVGFLIVHALLHLIGYDHDTEAKEEEMRRVQREILGDLI